LVKQSRRATVVASRSGTLRADINRHDARGCNNEFPTIHDPVGLHRAAEPGQMKTDAELPSSDITPADILRAVYATSRTVAAIDINTDTENATICRGYN
jgi:hypothetical protein